MKKILIFILAMVLAAPSVNAQNKILQKAIKKEFNAKIKSFHCFYILFSYKFDN